MQGRAKPARGRKGPLRLRHDGAYTITQQVADVRLADDYMMGKGVTRNPTTAKRLLLQAAQGPDAKWRGEANCTLGNLYEEGIQKYIKRDRHAALEHFRKAEADGSDYAPHRIRLLEYFPDLYIKLRQEEFAPPPRGTKAPGSLRQADKLYDQEKFVEALPIFTYHAKRGTAEAQFTLAMMYVLGQGVKTDEHRCRAWCYLAAKSGLTEAQTALGHALYYDCSIYDTGHEIEPWLKRAAKRNDPDAIMLLGLLAMSPRNYDNNWDVRLGLKRLKKAASLGSSVAMLNLGDYYSGRKKHVSMTTNLDQAKKWYMAAANAGEAEARTQLRKQFKIKYDAAAATDGEQTSSEKSRRGDSQKRTTSRASRKK